VAGKKQVDEQNIRANGKRFLGKIWLGKRPCSGF
jgi:hypothetical protein